MTNPTPAPTQEDVKIAQEFIFLWNRDLADRSELAHFFARHASQAEARGYARGVEQAAMEAESYGIDWAKGTGENINELAAAIRTLADHQTLSE